MQYLVSAPFIFNSEIQVYRITDGAKGHIHGNVSVMVWNTIMLINTCPHVYITQGHGLELQDYSEASMQEERC